MRRFRGRSVRHTFLGKTENQTKVDQITKRDRQARIGRIYAYVGSVGLVVAGLLYFLAGWQLFFVSAAFTFGVFLVVGVAMVLTYERGARSGG